MQHLASKFTKRNLGFVFGAALVVFGLYGLISELVEWQNSEDIAFGYVLAGLFITSGVLVSSATRIRYAGGAWFPFGIILVVGGFAGAALELDDFLRHTQDSALCGATIAAVLLGLGSLCLVFGHLRHRRKSRSLSNETIQQAC